MDKVAVVASLMLQENSTVAALYDDVEQLDEEVALLLCTYVSDERTVQPKMRIKLFTETVVPLYSDRDFRMHFRLTRETTEVSWSLDVVSMYLKKCTTSCFQNNWGKKFRLQVTGPNGHWSET